MAAVSARRDTAIARLGGVGIGRFRCATGDPRFHDSGPIGGWLVVFPRTSVWITHAGKEPVLADPSRAMLYNSGQEYRRAKIDERGDRCEWFAFDPRAVAEAHARFEPRKIDDETRIFDATHAPVDARTYALQRRVFEHAASGGAIDPLFVEEASLAILARVVAAIPRGSSSPDRPGARASAKHAALADAVRQLLARDPSTRASLTSIARAHGASAFHLARVFRAHVGSGVHAYRTQLRLRASLERVAAGEDLTRVALDLGFSSRAHFTASFARAFGVAPRGFRAEASSSKISKAERAIVRPR